MFFYGCLLLGGMFVLAAVVCGAHALYSLGRVVEKILLSIDKLSEKPVKVTTQRSADEGKLAPLEEKISRAHERIGRLDAVCVGLANQIKSVGGTFNVANTNKTNDTNNDFVFDGVATKEETTELGAKIEALQVNVQNDRRLLFEMRSLVELLRQDRGGASGQREDGGMSPRQAVASPGDVSAPREAPRAGQARVDDNDGRRSPIDQVVLDWNRTFEGGAEVNDETFLRLQRRTGWSYSVFPHNTDLVICYRRKANGQQPVATVLARIGAMANFVGEHYFEKARDSGPKAKVLRVLRHATLRPMDDEKFRDLLDGKGMFGEMGSLRAYVQEKGEVDVES